MGRKVVEWLKDIWPVISAPVGAAIMAVLQWALTRRQREADVAKTKAESNETLARAQKTLSESRSVEAAAMADAIEALGHLNELLQSEAGAARNEAKAARKEAREANERSKSTERKYNTVLVHAERLEDLLSAAISYIDALIERMKAAEITPPPLPQSLVDWVAERNGKES